MLGRFEEAILLVLIGAKGEATTAEIYEALSEKTEKGFVWRDLHDA